jgi:hypothetical protein
MSFPEGLLSGSSLHHASLISRPMIVMLLSVSANPRLAAFFGPWCNSLNL